MTDQAGAVHVTIEELVVTGFGPAEARAAVEALRRGLATDLTGSHLAARTTAVRDSRDPVRVPTTASRAPRDVGAAAARAISTAVQQAGGR